MPRKLFRTAAVAIALFVGASLVLAQASKGMFRPPRTAVVDIYEVFENFNKKLTMEKKLEKEAEQAQAAFSNLRNRLKTVEEELAVTSAGTKEHDDLVIQKTKLGLELTNFQKNETAEFQKKHMRAVKAIREEIAAEIQRYAEAHELDMVLEKRFSAEARGLLPVKWPIVHFVRPEIEITGELINILNSKP